MSSFAPSENDHYNFRLSKMSDDAAPPPVPMLSQDEFFRHLELQSVHSVKFTYRQVLKERLRATTKQVRALQITYFPPFLAKDANIFLDLPIYHFPKFSK